MISDMLIPKQASSGIDPTPRIERFNLTIRAIKSRTNQITLWYRSFSVFGVVMYHTTKCLMSLNKSNLVNSS